ncbi:MAG: cell division protein FtsX [Pseudomonadota bacterium]
MSDSQREAPLLPVEDAREAALFFVVCALCFLAALAALTGRATYGAAQEWTSDVEGELTIRLSGADMRAADAARDLVADMPNVRDARVLDRDETATLLEPWFGSSGLPSSLPLPILIAVQADPSATDMGPNIQRRLTEEGFAAAVDEHSDWAGDVRRALGSVRLAALGAVALLAATAVAVIAFATHAALLARKDIVEVLHLSGAEDRFVSRLFERRFWVLALRAGSVGALAALGAASLLSYSLSQGGGRDWLLPTLRLDLVDLSILISTPIMAAFAARFAARITVLRSLAETV